MYFIFLVKFNFIDSVHNFSVAGNYLQNYYEVIFFTCTKTRYVKNFIDMALGGMGIIFGVKFLNRVGIRNFHECYPLFFFDYNPF